MSLSPSAVAVESAARESYSQLISWLAVRADGDLAGAEDALSEAFLAALKQWPDEGIPDHPNAWLLQTARRKLVDGQRRSHTRRKMEDAISHAIETGVRETEAGNEFTDERLKLLFVCAHPHLHQSHLREAVWYSRPHRPPCPASPAGRGYLTDNQGVIRKITRTPLVSRASSLCRGPCGSPVNSNCICGSYSSKNEPQRNLM